MERIISTARRVRPVALASRPAVFALVIVGFVVAAPRVAEAQLDPLLFLKRTLPTLTTNTYRAHVLIAMDTSPRMQVRRGPQLLRSRTTTPPATCGTSRSASTAAATRDTAGSTRASSSRRRGSPKYQPRRSPPSAISAAQLAAYNALLREDPARRRQGRRAAGDCREHEVHAVRPDRHAPGEPAYRRRRSTTARCKTTTPVSRSRPTAAGLVCGS